MDHDGEVRPLPEFDPEAYRTRRPGAKGWPMRIRTGRVWRGRETDLLEVGARAVWSGRDRVPR